ncbi:MAG: outer membrane lipoprotein carrier protein LolA [Acidobacteria bacterium]|nr:outer membrane lipoprotein carrier protein LolA [Acidobacteriota bacterium]
MKTLLLALTLTLPAAAQTPPTAAALAHTVDAHYNHFQSLSAHFTERYQGMGIDRTESGTLLLRKPGRMRWAYTSGSSSDAPIGKLFILDGKFAINYTPGDAQATRIPAKQLDDLRSPLRFLLGHTDLTRELDNLTLTLVTAPPHPTYTLSGSPKGMQQSVQSIGLTVDSSGQIESMRIQQTDGSTTTFTFTDIHDNVPTTPADFTFTPPPGVTLIDGTAPI